MRVVNFSIDSGNKNCIIQCEPELFLHVREHFSVANQNARFQRRFSRFTPKRFYAITPTGRFLPGLYYHIKHFIKKTYNNIEFHADEKIKNVVFPSYDIKDIASLKLDLRDYQKDIVKKALGLGRGIIVLATAGGKTLTTACIIESIFKKVEDKNNFRCLVVVPTLNLVYQTSKDFTDYNVSFSHTVWTGSDDPDASCNIIVANTGILQSSNSNIEDLKHVDLLIVDEVHMLRKSNKISKFIKNINTPNKFGLTGTLPDDKLDQWNIFGTIGPKIYEKNSKDLRDDNYIGNVLAKIINITYVSKPEATNNPTKRYRKELEFISKNVYRNNIISKICKPLTNNCLVMVDFIEHGQRLFESMKNISTNKQVFFIKGDVEIDERERIRHLMEQTNDVIVIAISKIFSTGINIKNLHYIVFAGGGKAKIKIIQSIGRGLRLHQGEKNLIIIDISDNLHYGKQHSDKRLELYNNEKIQFNIQKLTEGT